MENNVQQILKDLYSIDPSLKEKEALLVQLIDKLIQIKSDIVVDSAFVEKLRTELIAKTSEVKILKNNIPWYSSIGLNYAAGSLVLVAIILVAGNVVIDRTVEFAPGIKDLSDNGFGPLAFQGGAENVRNQSGGGGGDRVVSLGIGAGGGGGSPGIDPKMIAPAPPYEVTQIVYKYVGQDFTQDQDSVPVYKRVVDQSVLRSLTRNITRAGLGLADLTKLRNAQVNDINIAEDREYGYLVSANLREGWLSFYQNWEKWPQPPTCYDELSCQRTSFIEASQLPSDDVFIKAADAFLDEYKIDHSSYGPGKINESWRNSFTQFPRAADTGAQLVGLDIPVLYSLKIDDKEVYEEWGSQLGIYVTVNANTMKVTSVGNIWLQNYEKSNYPAETDINKILELAELGGSRNFYQYEIPTKIITVELGTPTIQLAQIYHQKPGAMKADVLFVPSLVFPVSNISDRQYFQRDNVVIPIVKELFDARYSPEQPPYPIMPLEKPIPVQ